MSKVNWKELGISPQDAQWVRIQSKWLSLIDIKGGKCEGCGEEDSSCFEFHSTNPEVKDSHLTELITRQGKKGWESAQEIIDNFILLCSNCHHDLHFPRKEGKASHRRELSQLNKWSCDLCNYNSNLGVLGVHDDYVLCKNCYKKETKDISRWNRLLPYIEQLKSESKSNDLSWLTKDKEWLKEFDRLYKNEKTYKEMAKTLFRNVKLCESLKVKTISDVAKKRIDKKLLHHRGLDRLRAMETPDLVRDVFVSKFLKFRELNYSVTRACSELRICRSYYHEIFHLLKDRGLVSYRREPNSYLHVDDDIIRMSNDGMPATEIAREIGCCPKTIQKKRMRLIQEGKMKKPDYSAYNRGRSAWNKGNGRELNEDTLTEQEWWMIVMREDGRTAVEVAKELGKTPAAVRSFYSRCIKAGIIEKKT